MFEKVGDRAKRGLQRKGGPDPRGPPLEIKKTPTLRIGSCNQNYSRALLVNKISLVFLQSIKVILTLFFMPTIKILMQIYAIQAKISRYCTCLSRILTNLRKPRREHFAFVHNDYIIHYLLAQTF